MSPRSLDIVENRFLKFVMAAILNFVNKKISPRVPVGHPGVFQSIGPTKPGTTIKHLLTNKIGFQEIPLDYNVDRQVAHFVRELSHSC